MDMENQEAPKIKLKELVEACNQVTLAQMQGDNEKARLALIRVIEIVEGK